MVLYLLNAIQLFIYVGMQILLVTRTLRDRWPLGDIAFGVFFFVVGQVILYAFSAKICTAVSHYLDGLFFATVCNLLGVMMVYKVRFDAPTHPSRPQRSKRNPKEERANLTTLRSTGIRLRGRTLNSLWALG